jgi:Holliday junction resolvase
MIRSKQKGARAERALRDELRTAGWMSARRGQQFKGTPDSPDVICEELDCFRFECKHRERGNDPFAFMEQAARDAGAQKIPIVAMRKNNHAFLVVLQMADFFAMLKSCDLPALASRERRTT